MIEGHKSKPWWLAYPLALAAFVLAATAPTVIPDQYEVKLFLAAFGILLLVGALDTARRLEARAWLRRHVWWRFSRNPPSFAALAAHSGPLDQLKTVDLTPRAWPLATDEDRFDYPEPKALLRFRIDKERGEGNADQFGVQYSVSIVGIVESVHHTRMVDCHLFLTHLEENGRRIDLNQDFKKFEIEKNSSKRFTLISRNISDKLTPESFRLALKPSPFIMKDNSTYILHVELRSRYPLPTLVTIEVVTETGLKLAARVNSQQLATL